jgi:hypothetical protein
MAGEEIMKLSGCQLRDESGVVLVIALLVLLLLTLIGISATTTSEVELQIVGNEKFHKAAFHRADSGVYVTPKLISACFDSGVEQNVAGITYLGSSGTFYREMMGYDAHDPDKDIRFTLEGFHVDVDVDFMGTEAIAGGAVEFGSGAEGIGTGTGGVAALFGMDSFGEGSSASLSNVFAVYRKVIGVPGGL